MKIGKFYQSSKKFLPVAAILGVFFFLVYGFPLPERTLDGSLLTGLLGRTVGPNALLQHCSIALLLFATVFAALCLCDLKRPYVCLLATALSLLLPTAVFAQTYSCLEGCLSIVPTTVLSLVYWNFASKSMYWKQKPWLCLVLLPLALLSQLFDLRASIVFCLLSASVFTYRFRKLGFSLPLAAHLLGSCLGCTLQFLTNDASRLLILDVSSLLSNLETVTGTLFANSLPLLAVMTTACLLLLQPFRENRSARCNRALALLFFPLLILGLTAVAERSLSANILLLHCCGLLRCAAGVCYFCGLWLTVNKYVAKSSAKYKLQFGFVALAASSLPLLLFRHLPLQLLYLPYMILLCMALLLLRYALRSYPVAELRLRKPLLALSCTVLAGILWISLSNAVTVDVWKTHIEAQMHENAQEIELPCYPYEAYIAETTPDHLAQTYYYTTPGDVVFRLTAYETWDWETYFATSNREYQDDFDKTYEEMSEKEELE